MIMKTYCPFLRQKGLSPFKNILNANILILVAQPEINNDINVTQISITSK